MTGLNPYELDGTRPAQLLGDRRDASRVDAVRLRPPTREQLTYTRELLTVVLLLCAFPWLLGKLLTDPAKVLGGGAITKSV